MIESRKITRRALCRAAAFGVGISRAPAYLAAPSGRLQAGTAIVNITPPLGVSIAGNMTDRIAAEVHDELHVRALALDNGRKRIAIATVDSCAVPRTILDKAKQQVADEIGLHP